MKSNLGSTDRWIRVIIGLGILALGFTFKSWWGLVGVIPLATGALGYCGLYTLLGLNTGRSRRQEAPRAS